MNRLLGLYGAVDSLGLMRLLVLELLTLLLPRRLFCRARSIPVIFRAWLRCRYVAASATCRWYRYY